MSMKKSDLARRLESKLEGRMKGQGVPQRFGTAAAVPDRREQRRLMRRRAWCPSPASCRPTSPPNCASAPARIRKGSTAWLRSCCDAAWRKAADTPRAGPSAGVEGVKISSQQKDSHLQRESAYMRSFSERLGCLSLRIALASTWRMRSRLTSNWRPTSSSV